jgi:hypothetical protein
MVVTKMDRRADGTARMYVCHFWSSTDKKADAIIRRSELVNSGELARAGLLLRLQYQHFTSSRILQRAGWLTRYNRAQYDLFHRNCEHAATNWLRTGYARSPQAEHVLRTVCMAVRNVVMRRVRLIPSIIHPSIVKALHCMQSIRQLYRLMQVLNHVMQGARTVRVRQL